MKRYLWVLLTVAICVFSLQSDARMSTMIVGGQTVAAGGATYDDIDLYWGCESLTIEKSAGDNSALADSGATINGNNSPPVGSNSCDYPTNYDYHYFEMSNNDIFSFDQVRIGFYVYVENWPGADQNVIYYRVDAGNYLIIGLDSGTGDELNAEIKVDTTGVITATSSGANMAADTWYYVEVYVDNTASATDTVKIFVDGAERGSNTGTIDQMGTTSVQMQQGGIANGGDLCHIDQLLISADITRDLNAIKGLTSFPDS